MLFTEAAFGVAGLAVFIAVTAATATAGDARLGTARRS
jgi:hypothetical protein